MELYDFLPWNASLHLYIHLICKSCGHLPTLTDCGSLTSPHQVQKCPVAMTRFVFTIQDTVMLEVDATPAANFDFKEVMFSPENSERVRFWAGSKVILRGEQNLQPSVTSMHLKDSWPSGWWCRRIETLPLCNSCEWFHVARKMRVNRCIVDLLVCIATAIVFQVHLLSKIVSLPLL